MTMNKYRPTFATALLIVCLLLSATPISSSPLGEDLYKVLKNIEKNNTTLVALRAETDARKLTNRTGITLADPEIGYKHMQQGGEQSGNLTELSIGQSFDLSTVLGYKSRAAESQNRLVDEEYRLVRMDILLDAQLTYIDLAYYNALARELERRLTHAQQVVEAEQHRLESGDTDILAYNNVLLNLASLKAERERIVTEQTVLTNHLTNLNGGAPLNHLESLESPDCLGYLENPENLDSLVTQAMQYSPMMSFARTRYAAAKSDLALSKAQQLPTLSATYINERHTIGDRSQGVAIGVSLPLWANKNRIHSARAALQAAQAAKTDTELQLRSQLRADYERVLGLQRTATLYRTALAEVNNTHLLTLAMNEGHISVLEYLQGIELYYDYLDRSLSAERDYHRALAQLEAWKL